MAIGVCVFILLAGNAMKDIARLLAGGRLPIGFFLELLMMLVPYVISYALPLGLLIGVLAVFGRLSAQNEITAMKASGLSLYSIASPVLLLAFIGSILALGINFYYAPVAKAAYRQSVKNVLRENPLQFIEPHTFIKDFPGYVIYASERDGNYLRNFWIWELNPDKQASIFIKAESGEVTYDEKTDALVLDLEQGVGEKRRRGDPENMQDNSVPTLYFDKVSIRLPLDKIFGDQHFRKGVSMMNFNELLAERNKFLKEEQAGDPKAFTQRIKFQMQIQKNFAMAFSVIALATVAIPLGIRSSRSETYANSAIALGLAMVFYFLVVAVSWLEKKPHLRPDLLIWTPTILFQIIGCILFRRMNQH
jgi:lipopolysaccharide export system permease protein